MIVSPRFMVVRAYLERKKKGWMLVLNVLSHVSLLTCQCFFPPKQRAYLIRRRLTR